MILRDPTGGSLVVAATLYTERASAAGRAPMEGRLFSLDGDTLAQLDGCMPISPTGRWTDGVPEFICWRPTWEWLPVAGTAYRTPLMLFPHNYEGILRHFDEMSELLRACLATARYESLSVRSEIVAVEPDGSPRGQPIDAGYGRELESPLAIRTSQGDVAVLRAAGGYQSADWLYRLLGRPRVGPANPRLYVSTDMIQGSFRGLVAIDPAIGEILWARPIGATPLPVAVGDVNGDGLDEFVVSTYSPENGVSQSGTTDAGTAYVICLDWCGNVLWRHSVHGEYAGVQAAIADVSGGRKPEIVAVWSSTSLNEQGGAVVLDGSGATISSREDLGGLYGLVVADVCGDRRSEIVTGAPGGRLLALDGELGIVASFRDTAHRACDDSRLIPLAANDVDGDGDVEILVASVGWSSPGFVPSGRRITWDPVSYVVSLGPGLREEARAPVSPLRDGNSALRLMPAHPSATAAVCDVEGDGRNEVLISSTSVGLIIVEVVSADES
ncbi:MAG: hypothetical protein ABIE42_11955 [Candidatus Eisenbacteria bacterium]